MTNSHRDNKPSHGSSRDDRNELSEHRQNLLRATATVISDQGYATATVTQIARVAGVSRSGFYTAFHNKEDALRAVLTYTSWQTLTRVRAATSPSENWPERVYLGLRELLSFFAKNPQLARVVFVEAQVAGPRAMTIVYQGMRDYTNCFTAPAEDIASQVKLPDSLIKQVLGAIYFRIYDALASGDAASLPDLLPEVVEIALLPYIGPQQVMAVLGTHEHNQQPHSH
jgi:AcrR family transcriptional regulator